MCFSPEVTLLFKVLSYRGTPPPVKKAFPRDERKEGKVKSTATGGRRKETLELDLPTRPGVRGFKVTSLQPTQIFFWPS